MSSCQHAHTPRTSTQTTSRQAGGGSDQEGGCSCTGLIRATGTHSMLASYCRASHALHCPTCIDDVAMVLRMYGKPEAAAARAMASSPSGWHSRCWAMGANRMGEASRCPAPERGARLQARFARWARTASLYGPCQPELRKTRWAAGWAAPGVQACRSGQPSKWPLTKQSGAGVHLAHIHQHAGQQAVPLQRLLVLAQRPLVVAAAGIVAVRLGCVATEDAATEKAAGCPAA